MGLILELYRFREKHAATHLLAVGAASSMLEKFESSFLVNITKP